MQIMTHHIFYNIAVKQRAHVEKKKAAERILILLEVSQNNDANSSFTGSRQVHEQISHSISET
jgi:hypothetical protein